MSRKRLLIAAFVSAAVIGFIISIVVVLLPDSPQDTPKVDNFVEPNTLLEGVNSIASELEPTDVQDSQKAIEGIVRQNVPNVDKTYKANYRQGSLRVTVTAQGVPLKRFLVDIPELERTFAIEIEGGFSSDYKTMYALCPTPSELVYKPQSCVDTP
jgi:hypothetical protein